MAEVYTDWIVVIGKLVYGLVSAELFCILALLLQVPEPDSAIQSISIDSEGAYMAAVNTKVWKFYLDTNWQSYLDFTQ